MVGKTEKVKSAAKLIPARVEAAETGKAADRSSAGHIPHASRRRGIEPPAATNKQGIDQNEGPADTILLSGSLTLQTVDATRTSLLDGLSGRSRIVVDMSAASSGDITLLQLLIATRRSAREARRDFAIASPMPQFLCELMDQAGISVADLELAESFPTKAGA